MKNLLATVLLMVPLCGYGYDVVSFPRLFKEATMEIRACGLDVNDDGYPDVIMLKSGPKGDEEFIKAMMPHEFLDALNPEYPPEEQEK